MFQWPVLLREKLLSDPVAFDSVSIPQWDLMLSLGIPQYSSPIESLIEYALKGDTHAWLVACSEDISCGKDGVVQNLRFSPTVTVKDVENAPQANIPDTFFPHAQIVPLELYVWV